MPLSEIIIQKIKQEGAIPFRDFMEMALYYPELGYYTSTKEKIGKTGDYYTSPNLTPVFGEMIGRQLEEMWHTLGRKEFTVVEMGAGMGLLSGDVLAYLKKNEELYNNLNYCIIEKSPAMRREQKKLLREKVTWHDSLQELRGIKGCIFSNELVDAFPVHLVVMENELMEVFVDYENGFIEILKPASYDLKNYFDEPGVVLPHGYRTEVNLEAIKWIKEIGASLNVGFVITIDYGYPSFELYQEYRNRGTLMCYYKHTANETPFEHIGEQDITSHVNFSALLHWGRKNGLELCGFTDQSHFLMGLGIEDYLKRLQENEPENYLKKMLPVKTLMMEMGDTFKILIQEKGVDCRELSGLKYLSRWQIQ
ncbi:MAG: SAM-dependent methyltransferase [Candidatus Methanoperedens sp.]|nr:SAM-dependent methyltransferase [Candidatus Methanoperedens sp.]MCZ7406576.1 SAM-dependent methyltransferase [Candidatus Methanoperedens sp.]